MKESKLLDMIKAAEEKKRSLDLGSEIADMIEVQAITEQDFADAIAKTMGGYKHSRRHSRPKPIDTSQRPLYAALCFAYYGHPNSVMIAAQGSPPPMTVVVHGLNYSGLQSGSCEVYVNGKRLLPHRAKQTMVCTVVDCFLRSPAFLSCLARNEKQTRCDGE